MILFFDTETTGKADFKRPADDPIQPRIVQIGAILCTEERRIVGELNLLIRPAGFTIPADAAAIHGITTELASQAGLEGAVALGMLSEFVGRARRMVAHNLAFDRLMVMIELLQLDAPANLVAEFRDREGYCTMQAATPHCRLPHRSSAYGRSGYKWPSLQEAHRHFCGVEFDDAHDAMADVRACMRIYWALQEARS